MFQKYFYPKGTTSIDIIKAIQMEAFNPILISDRPGYVHKTHNHPETKLVVCIAGSMKVIVDGKKFNFNPGDKLLIPGNTLHSALIGEDGCQYFWSEKIVK